MGLRPPFAHFVHPPLVRPSTPACRSRGGRARYRRAGRFRRLAWLDWGDPDKINEGRTTRRLYQPAAMRKLRGAVGSLQQKAENDAGIASTRVVPSNGGSAL